MKLFSVTFFFTLFCSSFFINAGDYNFENDYEYRQVLIRNHVIASDWTAVKKNEIPGKLLKFAATNTDFLKKSSKNDSLYLIPEKLINFKRDGKFEFLWEGNFAKTGVIKGVWKIENGMLILTLSEDYIKPYVKGAELRYQILGTDKLRTVLLYKGKTFPPVTGILKTSNSPMEDMQKIIVAEQQAIVAKKYPEIMETKEKKLKTEILSKNKKEN